MAVLLTSADINKWYKGLNIARTQSGVRLNSIIEPNYTSKETYDRVLNLINNIVQSRKDSEYLSTSDLSEMSSSFAAGNIIRNIDRTSIENDIYSLLRICPNQVCTQTTISTDKSNSTHQNANSNVCITTDNSNGTNGNGDHNNGDKTNGAHSNGTNENQVCSLSACAQGDAGSYGNGTCAHGTKSNTYHANGVGNNNEICLHGHNSNGLHTKGADKANGTCNNGTQYVSSNGSDGYMNTNSDGTQGNGLNANGRNTNGTFLNGTLTNGYNTNEWCTNGTNTNQTKSNETCINGENSNGLHSNGYSNSTLTNGTNSDGCNQKFSNSNKNYYTEEQAKNRLI